MFGPVGTRRSGFPPLLTLMLAAAAARILVLWLWPNHFNESLADHFPDVEHDLIRFSLPMTVMTFLLRLTGVKSLASGERPSP
jgi:hypothetical protein